jgi:hypothetical protein
MWDDEISYGKGQEGRRQLGCPFYLDQKPYRDDKQMRGGLSWTGRQLRRAAAGLYKVVKAFRPALSWLEPKARTKMSLNHLSGLLWVPNHGGFVPAFIIAAIYLYIYFHVVNKCSLCRVLTYPHHCPHLGRGHWQCKW